MNITGLLGSWVVYSGELARACGGVNAAIFASYVAFRSNRTTDGWVTITREEISAATALSHESQFTARRQLRAAGVLEEREERLKHLMHFRLVEEKLMEMLNPSGFPKPLTTVSGDRPERFRETVQDGFVKGNVKEDVKEVPVVIARAQEPEFLDGPVPEWLTVLRKAAPYKLTAAKETALIRSVSTLGCAPDRLMSAAESLASQWPYKQHKHIDMTLLSWLRRNGNGNGTAQTNGGVLGATTRGPASAKPDDNYAGWESVLRKRKPREPVEAPRDSNGTPPAGLLNVPPSPATEPGGKTAGG